MANFRQYTNCVDIANFDPRNPFGQAALIGLYVTLPAAVVPLLMVLAGGNPLCLLLLAEIYLIAGIIGYTYWWLFRRLICIPGPPDHPADGEGNHIAIGTLIDVHPPGSSDSVLTNIDNDYSIGILLACSPLGITEVDQAAAASPTYGHLLEKQPVTQDAGLIYTGTIGVDHEFPGQPELEIRSQVLHCEFEGRGIFDMFLASRAALLPVVAALFACQIPGIGWIIALILALFGIGVLGIGLGVGQFDAGDPTDVNPNIGELHLNDANHQGADTLMIMGHWIYDAGHRFDYNEGWYELHPITMACKTTPVTDCDPGQVILLRTRWRNAIGDATSDATLANQKLPQNQWQVHPLLDGCQQVVIS
jgi:hypothetical protein